MAYKIEIDKLILSFGDRTILNNISLNIKLGDFISIVGPNGSGKSTLLKAISAVISPQSGCILLNEKDIFSLKKKEVAHNISVVPQNTSFEFDFKVKDVVLMGRHPHINRFKGETLNDKEIAEKSMKYTNVFHLKDRYFTELSGGEKQRVILAQALAQEPKVMLLDEPVSQLDLQYQVEILDLIKRMSMDNGLTVVTVLHDLNMASVYSDYIVMMKSGEIEEYGRPYDVLTKENIKEIFNTDVHISVSPVSNTPYIYTLTNQYAKDNGIKVHIICGGGSGYEIINELNYNGFIISTGVLNEGDLDWKISKENDVEIAEEHPFVEISNASYTKNMELIKSADYIVLTDLYFSKANIKNLEILLEDDLLNKEILIIDDYTFKDRDYTGGVAADLYNNIKKIRNVKFLDKAEVCNYLLREGNVNDK